MSEEQAIIASMREHSDDLVVGSKVADLIERLIRERDEARKLADYYASGFTEEAEARGYRRGVEDAADAVELHETNWRVGPSENKVEVRAAILALLEQTAPGEKK